MTKPTPKLADLIKAEPDLVDRIFDYILKEMPEVAASVQKHKDAVRSEFRGEHCYIMGKPTTQRQETVCQVLALFNGRNAREVARKLGIGKTTVYRIIKQAGGIVPRLQDLGH